MKKVYSIFILSIVVFGLNAQNFVPTFESYRNVVLEELTGINCQYCPDGHARANSIKNSKPERVVLINIHAGGFADPDAGQPDFRTPIGNYIDNLLDPSGYPSGAINRWDHNNDNSLATGRGDWQGMANDVIPETSPVNVAAMASIDMSTGVLTVDVEAFYTSDGLGASDKLHVFILQNNVLGPQVGSAANPSQIDGNGNYIHNHMFRHSLTGTTGTVINDNSEGSLFQNQYTYTIPASYTGVDVVLTDLELVVFVSEGTENIYTGAYANLEFTTSDNGIKTDLTAVNFESASGTCDDNFSPLLTIFNKSSVDITNIKVDYTVNGSVSGMYVLNTLSTPISTGLASFYVPSVPLSDGVNNIVFKINEINASTNTSPNNTFSYSIETPQSVALDAGAGTIDLVQDQYGTETTWELTNTSTGSVIVNGGPYANLSAAGVSAHSDSFTITDDNTCYSFVINDSYGDGICCDYGNGSYSVQLNGQSVANGGTFGGKEGTLIRVGNPSNTGTPQQGLVANEAGSSSSTIMEPVGFQNIETTTSIFKLYPNPTAEELNIEFTSIVSKTKVSYIIQDLTGKTMLSSTNQFYPKGDQRILVDVSGLSSGNYVLFVYENDLAKAHKFSIAK